MVLLSLWLKSTNFGRLGEKFLRYRLKLNNQRFVIQSQNEPDLPGYERLRVTKRVTKTTFDD